MQHHLTTTYSLTHYQWKKQITLTKLSVTQARVLCVCSRLAAAY